MEEKEEEEEGRGEECSSNSNQAVCVQVVSNNTVGQCLQDCVHSLTLCSFSASCLHSVSLSFSSVLSSSSWAQTTSNHCISHQPHSSSTKLSLFRTRSLTKLILFLARITSNADHYPFISLPGLPAMSLHFLAKLYQQSLSLSSNKDPFSSWQFSFPNNNINKVHLLPSKPHLQSPISFQKASAQF